MAQCFYNQNKSYGSLLALLKASGIIIISCITVVVVDSPVAIFSNSLITYELETHRWLSLAWIYVLFWNSFNTCCFRFNWSLNERQYLGNIAAQVPDLLMSNANQAVQVSKGPFHESKVKSKIPHGVVFQNFNWNFLLFFSLGVNSAHLQSNCFLKTGD